MAERGHIQSELPLGPRSGVPGRYLAAGDTDQERRAVWCRVANRRRLGAALGIGAKEFGELLGMFGVAYICAREGLIVVGLLFAAFGGALLESCLRSRNWRDGNSPSAVRRRQAIERLRREQAPPDSE